MRASLPSRLLRACRIGVAASAAVAAPVLAGPSGLDAFVARHHCEVLAGLTILYETAHPRDRYLILSWPPADPGYVQCLFEDDNSAVLCEAASGFYLKSGWRVSANGKAALAGLGFSMDGSKGNFAQTLKLDAPPNLEKITRLMLNALYQGYRGWPDRKIDWTAPWAPFAAAALRCAPTA